MDLRPGLSFCEVGDHLVFLDLAADRYFCLAQYIEQDLRLLLSDEDHGPDTQSLGRLADAGVLVERGKGVNARPCPLPEAATASILDTVLPKARLFDIMKSLTGLARARIDLTSLGLAGAIASVLAAKGAPQAPSAKVHELGAIMSGFVGAGRLFTMRDACLIHSLAVARALLASCLDAQLILGVRLGPFAAHCWVQHRGWVINDRVDTIRVFTPILVV